MKRVKVTFYYTPEDEALDDKTGVTAEEYDRLMDQLMMEFGAEDVEIAREP